MHKVPQTHIVHPITDDFFKANPKIPLVDRFQRLKEALPLMNTWQLHLKVNECKWKVTFYPCYNEGDKKFDPAILHINWIKCTSEGTITKIYDHFFNFNMNSIRCWQEGDKKDYPIAWNRQMFREVIEDGKIVPAFKPARKRSWRLPLLLGFGGLLALVGYGLKRHRNG